jgi:hypothetical protein
MSVADDAQRMISLSEEYIEKVVGSNNRASNGVGSSIGSLEATRLETTGSLAQAVFLMGDGHPAVRGLVASSMRVNRKADEITKMLQDARNKMVDLDQLASVHAETIALIGRQLQQGK